MLKRSKALLLVNSYIKSILIIIALVAAVVAKDIFIIFAQLIVFSLLVFDKELIRNWGSIMLRLMPFFLSYHILALLFKTDYNNSIFFSTKMSLLVLISCFVFTSFDAKTILTDLKNITHLRVVRSSLGLMLLCGSIIDRFIEYNKAHVSEIQNKSIGTIVSAYTNSFVEVWESKELIQEQVESEIHSKITNMKPRTWRDVPLVLLIIIMLTFITNYPINYAEIFSTISL